MQDTVSFSLNMLLGTTRSAFTFLLSFFRPMTQFIREVAGQSWLGFALVFAIAFTLTLIRWGAKSKAVAVYAGSLEYIGKRGLIAGTAVMVLLGIEHVVEPVIAIIVLAIANSVAGAEPGIGQLAGFLLTASSGRTYFLGDVIKFYGEAHTAFPLGFRALMLVMVALGCMFMVGKAAGAVSTAARGKS